MLLFIENRKNDLCTILRSSKKKPIKVTHVGDECFDVDDYDDSTTICNEGGGQVWGYIAGVAIWLIVLHELL